jgi:hypothetical protein
MLDYMWQTERPTTPDGPFTSKGSSLEYQKNANPKAPWAFCLVYKAALAILPIIPNMNFEVKAS